MRILKSLALVTVVVGAIGCSNDTKPNPNNQMMIDGGTDAGGMIGDAGISPDGNVTPDGGAGMPDGAVTGIGLVDFVTGLVQGSTNATATPATLDDKTIIDTMDPAAFDKLLGI